MEETVVVKLCDTLIDLLSKKPISEISVKELVLSAKVHRSSYNYHFNSIEDVLNEVMLKMKAEMEDACKGLRFEAGTNKHHFVIEHILNTLVSNKKTVRVLVSAGYKDLLYQMILDVINKTARSHKVAFIDDAGNVRTLPNGPVLDIYFNENAYAIIARVDFFLSYDFELSVKEAIEIFKNVNKVRNQITACSDKYYETHNYIDHQ